MSRRNKGNHRNSRFAFGAQPLPKALSFISFISCVPMVASEQSSSAAGLNDIYVR